MTPAGGPLHAYYDLRVAPLSFDFLTYLCILRSFVSAGAYSDVILTIIRSRFRKTNHIELGYDEGYEDRKLHDVILSLVSLSFVKNCYVENSIPVRSNVSTYPAGYSPDSVLADSPITLMPATINQLIEQFNKTQDASFLSSVRPTKKSENRVSAFGDYVTLSIRFTPHSTARNGSHDDFFFVQGELRRAFPKMRVIFVPDQDDCYTKSDYLRFDWDVFLPASFDLDLRLALYSKAVANITWTGGLGSLLYLSGYPFILFGMHNEADVVSSEGFFRRKGPPFRQQLPWSRAHDQIIDWTPAHELTQEYLASRSVEFVKDCLNLPRKF